MNEPIDVYLAQPQLSEPTLNFMNTCHDRQLPINLYSTGSESSWKTDPILPVPALVMVLADDTVAGMNTMPEEGVFQDLIKGDGAFLCLSPQTPPRSPCSDGLEAEEHKFQTIEQFKEIYDGIKQGQISSAITLAQLELFANLVARNCEVDPDSPVDCPGVLGGPCK